MLVDCCEGGNCPITAPPEPAEYDMDMHEGDDDGIGGDIGGAAWRSAWVRDGLAALRFLTRLKLAAGSASGDLTGAARAFPLAGLVVGLGGGIVYVLASALSAPALVAAALAVTATALLTGALHEDGLADMADGFGGGRTIEDTLSIMRDSRTGAYGALALVLSVTIRVGALAAFAQAPGAALGALIAAHAGSRAGMAALMHLLSPARSDGLAASAGRPGFEAVAWAGGMAIVLALLGDGINGGLAALIVGAAAAGAVGLLAQRRLGGVTGDVLGAAQQASEAAMLVAAAACL
jgi:adenosylcobinamide-GDP ribazoletransferase